MSAEIQRHFNTRPGQGTDTLMSELWQFTCRHAIFWYLQIFQNYPKFPKSRIRTGHFQYINNWKYPSRTDRNRNQNLVEAIILKKYEDPPSWKAENSEKLITTHWIAFWIKNRKYIKLPFLVSFSTHMQYAVRDGVFCFSISVISLKIELSIQIS